MFRNFLPALVFLFLPVFTFAQSFRDGLYFGVNVNPGLMYNPQAYFPGAEFTTTSGVKAGYFDPKGVVGVFTGIQFTQYKYSAGHHGESGTQSLSFLEFPFGAKILAGPYRGTKFYIEPAVSLCFLTSAHFNGYSSRPDAYPSGDNKKDCTHVLAKPSLGWGFHINAGANCAVIVGWQISTVLGDTYNRIQTPAGNQHTTMAMQFGFEYHLRDIRRGRKAPPHHYRYPH